MYFRVVIFFIFSLFAWCNEVENDISEKQKEIYFLKGQLWNIEEQKKNQENLKLKNGFFVGATIGNSAFEIKNIFSNVYHPFLFGIRGGYQKFFENTQAGFRAYLDYLIGAGFVESDKYIYQNATVNFDVMADVMFDKNKKYGIGFFGGYGMGILSTQLEYTKSFLDLGLFVNFGISVILDIRHRIDLHLKVPPIKNFGNTLSTKNLYLITYHYNF